MKIARCFTAAVRPRSPRRRAGYLEVDMLVGMAVLALAVMPVGFSFVRERQVLKAEYRRAVANELVDGEMEILAAGAARNLPEGASAYHVTARAAAALPPGHFQVTKDGRRLRLEWLPEGKGGLGPVIRETTLP